MDAAAHHLTYYLEVFVSKMLQLGIDDVRHHFWHFDIVLGLHHKDFQLVPKGHFQMLYNTQMISYPIYQVPFVLAVQRPPTDYFD